MPDIRFLEIPTIRQQRTLATHVKVISEETLASYTAETPNTPIENMIERVVYIKEGDAGVCQTVAERLLEKWGHKQTSVIGKIPMTVSLDFREKVRVVAPTLNFDEEVVIQKKEHSVADYSTRITCGDIILSDNELLARILEEALS